MSEMPAQVSESDRWNALNRNPAASDFDRSGILTSEEIIALKQRFWDDESLMVNLVKDSLRRPNAHGVQVEATVPQVMGVAGTLMREVVAPADVWTSDERVPSPSMLAKLLSKYDESLLAARGDA